MARILNIVGAGQVGKVLGRLFALHASFVIGDVLNRSFASSQQAVAFIGAGAPAADLASLRPADLYLLAVPDDQIVACCAALADSGQLHPDSIVFHCSGALSSRDLQPAIAAGAAVASVHPVRSFADPAQVAQHFAGTFCSIEGDVRATMVLESALRSIDAQPVAIQAEAKTLYHAASVFACNYLVTLIDTALNAYIASGIPAPLARQLAQPLVMETVGNIFRLGPEQALTGPIARGDMATVARQQCAVSAWQQPAGVAYQAMADLTLALAQRKKAAQRG